jgi:mannose-1-phosphate guanylyltransferase/mannose-6-phosphate isomerase
MQLLPIILSGGSGTRLWPVSRESMPKPFMKLAHGKSLLQLTCERAWSLPGVSHAAVVTNMAYSYKTVEELMVESGAGQTTLLLEPVGRNTAPAIALSALWAEARFGPDAVLLVLAADHLIDDQTAFAASVADASSLAQREGRLVLFGIKPTSAETGYGYIECGSAISGSGACEASRFVEKPSVEVACQYVDRGNFVWNSGMFCFTVRSILTAMAQYAPQVLELAQHVASRSDLSAAGQVMFDPTLFSDLPNISIDYAVMEKANNVAVIPCSFGWSDIGSWKAVAEVHATDESGNATEGNVILLNSRGTYVRSEDRLVAAVGVEDLVVIDTPDAVLVAHKTSSQHVRDLVAQLKVRGHRSASEHTTVSRPWGSYTSIEEGAGFKIKRIVVNPGQSLSLQLHHKRAEHWVVVKGEAIVQVGDREQLTRVGEYRFSPLGEKHRLSNRSNEAIELVEVQIGDYLGEDDIVRLVDNYGRAATGAS